MAPPVPCRRVCDTLVSITDDGVLFAKNSDRDANEAQLLRWFPASDHPGGSRLRCTWIDIPQVSHTHAVVLSQPWWMWGAEIGANEHGLVIGNEAVYTNQPNGEPALLGMDLLRLALERATTAGAAVTTIVELLERHGQGGPCSYERPGATYHNSFLIADRDGAIVLETAGRHWATEIVAGRGRSISNGLTIPGFARRFANEQRGVEVACAARRSRTETSAASASNVLDMFAALRDHGSGGLVPDPSRGCLAGPCAHSGGALVATQTTASWVADLRADGIHWATATAAPCTSVFHPVRVDMPVELGTDVRNLFHPGARWWRHELLHRTARQDLGTAVGRFGDERDGLEQRWVDEPPPTAEAFVESEQGEQRWLAELLDVDLVDTRPGWFRDVHDGEDRRAELPDHSALVERRTSCRSAGPPARAAD